MSKSQLIQLALQLGTVGVSDIEEHSSIDKGRR